MPDIEALKHRLDDRVQRSWDVEGIAARFEKLAREGIPSKRCEPADYLARKQEILEGVEQRAEEYEYLSHGYEKCSLLPGIGARIAADIIIESMEKDHQRAGRSEA